MSVKRVLIAVWLACAAALEAQWQPTFLFEAFLQDPVTGVPMTGTRSMRFTIYNAPSGGDAVSPQEEHSVTLHEGWLHVLLTCTYPYWESERYIGICLLPNPVELTPRIRVTPVPSAYLSGRVISNFGISKFYRDAGISIIHESGVPEPEDLPEGKLNIYTAEWGGPTLIGLRARMSGTLIKGDVTEGTGIDIQTAGGCALYGRALQGTGQPGEPDTYKPGIGVKGEGRDYGGYFIGGLNTNPNDHRGTGGYFEGYEYAGHFKGQVYVKGDYTREYGSGDETRAMPIAYGNVKAGGSLASGTPNLHTSWNAGGLYYVIEISGETYAASGYVTVVTPIRAVLDKPGFPQKPVLSETFAIGGKLIVKFYGLDGNAAKRPFQFVTYKP